MYIFHIYIYVNMYIDIYICTLSKDPWTFTEELCIRSYCSFLSFFLGKIQPRAGNLKCVSKEPWIFTEELCIRIYMRTNICMLVESLYTHIYSRLQIGWHRILRIFQKWFQRTSLPIGFTISTKEWSGVVLMINPMRI